MCVDENSMIVRRDNQTTPDIKVGDKQSIQDMYVNGNCMVVRGDNQTFAVVCYVDDSVDDLKSCMLMLTQLL